MPDGESAITELDRTSYDALVLDLMMPSIDGMGVMDHLIETNPRMIEKTIVMTAFPKTAAKNRLHHVCGVISKPFDLDELLSQVRDC